MKHHNYSILLLILIWCANSFSCKKLIEVDPPIDRITNAATYNNDYSAAAVLTGIFNVMSQLTLDNALNPALSADELETIGEKSNFYSNNLNSSEITWDYGTIFMCNSAIEGITASKGLTEKVKQQLLGEAKFCRAFNYFYLVNLYGDVPLVLNTDYENNSLAGRTDKDVIYGQIVKDLQDAQDMLEAEYRGNDAVTFSSERLRPNKYTAIALLSRVYLYLEEWDKAEAMASSIINNSAFYELVSLDRVFLSDSKEAIWQLQNDDPYITTKEANKYILDIEPNNDYPYSLNDFLYNAFEEDDQRRTEWIGTTNSSHFPYKYKSRAKEPTDAYAEYVVVFRLAEQYLIRAEARAHQGNIIGSNSAIADLNIIRARAGLQALNISNVNDVFLAIEHERQVELFTEWGHRWLDLKRTNRVDRVMPAITAAKGSVWQTTDQLYPLPLADMQKDPNLRPQNPGY